LKQKTKYIIIGIIIIILIGLISFHFYFMRDPDIKIPKGDIIVSPASGTIIKIIDLDDVDDLEIEKGLIGKIKTSTKEVCDECYLISIFMSPLDVHIQRASVNGKVISVEHKNGTLYPTTSFEKALTNEKTETIIENPDIGKIKIIQIAGFVVRRIENWLEINQELELGEKIGLIRYGSQVSIILPKQKVELVVNEGDSVESGSSIIANII